MLLKLFLLTSLAFENAAADARDDDDRYHPRFKRSAPGPLKSPWMGVDWKALGKNSIRDSINNLNNINKGKAKNVIFFLGDGMGLPTVAAARLYQAETRGLKGTDTYLPWERFPFGSLSRTYNVDRSTPDSAGTATAFLCGIKANMATIGVNEKVQNGDCLATKGNEVLSVTKHSIASGKSTGIVTTTRITHASPAGCYANIAQRDWEASIPENIPGRNECNDIAYQLINNPINQNITVIMGGGISYFIPTNETDPEYKIRGRRVDGRNLLNDKKLFHDAKKNRYAFVKNRQELFDLDLTKTDYLMGLFATSHMSYEADRNKTKEPSLAEMTEKAIQVLKKNQNGYFLFVEGGRIDHSHHDTLAFKALNDTIAFADAVQKAVDITNKEDTLIIVTADHSHVFSLGGYASYEQSVFGFGDINEQPTIDNKPYLQLMYANGPGFDFHRNIIINGTSTEVPRKNLTGLDIIYDKEFQQDAGVWMEDETHGGEDVSVHALGPMAHLFHTTQEQSYIAHVMMYALCVGDYQSEAHCTTAQIVNNNTNVPSGTPGMNYNQIFFNFVVLLLLIFVA